MAGIKDALGAVFRIQRESRPVDRLLPPEQEALIHHIFVLKLEAARLALLRQQAATWRDLLREAQGWLAQYYAGGDARVMAAAAELERLAALDPAPRLAAPRQALEQLRAAAVLGR